MGFMDQLCEDNAQRTRMRREIVVDHRQVALIDSLVMQRCVGQVA
jgi:hypothetical protein